MPRADDERSLECEVVDAMLPRKSSKLQIIEEPYPKPTQVVG